MKTRQLTLEMGEKIGPLDALLLQPDEVRALYVFAHGAGAGMRHSFMEQTSQQLATLGVATLRYQFPYMQNGTGRPDPPAVLEATVRAAIALGSELAAGTTLIAGGKSMGGRMTSQAVAKQHDARVTGIAFVGFPLHQAKKPSIARAEHLASVRFPMLFLQGTRDALADLDLITRVTADLGERATLHVIDGADHSFSVLKRSGRTNEDVLSEIAQTIAGWVESLT